MLLNPCPPATTNAAPPPAPSQAALRAKDIVPRKDTVYRAADVAAAIEERYGARPLVHCYGEALSEVGEVEVFRGEAVQGWQEGG